MARDWAAAAAHVQRLRHCGGACATVTAVHGSVAHRHHSQCRSGARRSRTQSWRKSLGDLLEHHLPAEHAWSPGRLAPGVCHCHQLICRAGAYGWLASHRYAHQHLPTDFRTGQLAVRRNYRRDPVGDQSVRGVRLSPLYGEAHRRIGVTSAVAGADRAERPVPAMPSTSAREEPLAEAEIPLVFRIGAVLTLVVMLLPVVIVVLAGLNAGEYLTFPPQGLSLRWVIGFLTSPSLRTSYLLSLTIASVVMLFSTTLGTMAALFLTRVDFPRRSLMRAYFLAPLMLPGLVVGLALYVFYIVTNVGLARTLPGMIIGHVVVTVPYVIGTVSAALYNFDVSLEDAARSLGAGPVRTFRAITLPVISPGIMAGSIFAFIVSFGQFDISLFLSTPNVTPLPIAMYNSLRYRFEPTAAAAGVFAIALVVLSMLLTNRLTNLARFAGIKFS